MERGRRQPPLSRASTATVDTHCSAKAKKTSRARPTEEPCPRPGFGRPGAGSFLLPLRCQDRPERAYEDFPGKERCGGWPRRSANRGPGAQGALSSGRGRRARKRRGPHRHSESTRSTHTTTVTAKITAPAFCHEILRTAQRRLQERPPGGHDRAASPKQTADRRPSRGTGVTRGGHHQPREQTEEVQPHHSQALKPK